MPEPTLSHHQWKAASKPTTQRLTLCSEHRPCLHRRLPAAACCRASSGVPTPWSRDECHDSFLAPFEFQNTETSFSFSTLTAQVQIIKNLHVMRTSSLLHRLSTTWFPLHRPGTAGSAALPMPRTWRERIAAMSRRKLGAATLGMLRQQQMAIYSSRLYSNKHSQAGKYMSLFVQSPCLKMTFLTVKAWPGTRRSPTLKPRPDPWESESARQSPHLCDQALGLEFVGAKPWE